MGNEASKQAAIEEGRQHAEASLREATAVAREKLQRERAEKRAAKQKALAETEASQQLFISQGSEPGEVIDSQLMPMAVRSLDSSQYTHPTEASMSMGNGSAERGKDRSAMDKTLSSTNQLNMSKKLPTRKDEAGSSAGTTAVTASVKTSKDTNSLPVKRSAPPNAFADERRRPSVSSLPKIPRRSSVATPQSPDEPDVEQLQAVGDERPPRWYNEVKLPKSRAKKDAGVDVLLARLRAAIRNSHEALRNKKQEVVKMNELRDRLHKIVFEEVNGPLLKLHRVLHNDSGLPLIFDSELDWPFDIRADAQELYNKWARKVFETDILRGIEFSKKDGSSKTDAHINPGYKVNAKYFGNGDLLNGQWWPYQICALRDGAHGVTQGGISGSKKEGAYSCIMAGGLDKDGKEYPDIDNGDQVQYCGTDSNDGIPTDNTEIMLFSVNNKPVRLIRSFKAGTQYSPKEGYRYDGLYDVTGYERLDGHNSVRQRHRFTLVRRPGQDPIRGGEGPQRRPTKEELDEYKKNLKYSGRLN